MTARSRVAMVSGGVAVIVAIVAALAFFSSAPGSPDTLTQTQSQSANSIIIGTIHENAAKQITRFQPTADYIASKMGENYVGKVVVARDAAEMVEFLKNQKIDLYFDSPFIAASVSQESGAEPILVRWKEGVEEYHSVFIVRNDSPITSFEDLAGKTIGFESPYSSSGYLLPASHLIRSGLELTEGDLSENKVRYVFTGDDENTALWVIESRMDAGAFSNIDLMQTPDSMRSQLRVVAETDSVPRQVVSHRADMNPEEVQSIKEILLEMEQDQEGRRTMNEFEGTTRYTEVPEGLFTSISEIVARVQS